MTPWLAGRLALFAWSWRRPLLLAAAACLAVPFAMAAIVVQAQHTSRSTLLLPVQDATLTQPFGCTTLEMEPWSAECSTHHFHSGIDLAAPLDTPIFAATAGTVSLRRERGGYGLYLLVQHDARLTTLYAHLDVPLVQAGDQVLAGQLVALMGSSGNSTGPHLHFEVRVAGVPVDPLPLLPTFAKGGGR